MTSLYWTVVKGLIVNEQIIWLFDKFLLLHYNMTTWSHRGWGESLPQSPHINFITSFSSFLFYFGFVINKCALIILSNCLYILHYTQYIIQACTLYNIHYTSLHIIKDCKLYNIHYTSWLIIQACTLYNILYTSLLIIKDCTLYKLAHYKSL